MCNPTDIPSPENKKEEEHSSSSSTEHRRNVEFFVEQHPQGNFVADRDLRKETSKLDLSTVELEDGQILIQMEAYSVDAFVRTMLEEKFAYHGSRKIGDPLLAIGYGTIVKSASEKYKTGTRLQSMFPVANYVTLRDDQEGLQPQVSLPGVRASLSLGLFGLSGLTAYAGTFLVGEGPKKDETVVVSAAAGAVGSIVCQMTKLSGARVVGIAGGSKKCTYLTEELGLDGVVDYKDPTKTVKEQLKQYCPGGIDFFFDNVGGALLNDVLTLLNEKGGSRVIICGAISQYDQGGMYDSDEKMNGPSNYIKLAERNATMSGFNVMHYLKSPLNLAKMVGYLYWHYMRGNLKASEHVEKGVEKYGEALELLLAGGNVGRLVVEC